MLRNFQERVRRYHHSQWDVQHVLLSLLELGNDLPSQILAEMGLPEDQAEARLDQVLEAREGQPQSQSNLRYPSGGQLGGQRQAGNGTSEGQLHRSTNICSSPLAWNYRATLLMCPRTLALTKRRSIRL